MKKFPLLVTIVSLVVFSFQNLKAQENTDILINMTSDVEKDPHSSLMGLHMAIMAQEQGMNVTLFMNVHGVKLATKKLSKTKFAKENMDDLLEEIIENGGTILVCPHCMKIEDIKEKNLIDGAIISSPDKMAALMKSDLKTFTY